MFSKGRAIVASLVAAAPGYVLWSRLLASFDREIGASAAGLATQAITPQPAPLIKDAAAPSKAKRLKTPTAPMGDWKGTIWQSR
jgi:hypothetical protein